MKDKFYELSIKTSNFYDEILELVFSFGVTCVEELDHEIIIREEYDLKDIAWGIEEYAKGLSSVRKISNDLKNLENLKITEEDFSKFMYRPEIPDPELVIRTSGEFRISNFLLWEIAYSEFYITDVFWPDFDENELDKAILSFNKRDRRYGGLNVK